MDLFDKNYVLKHKIKSITTKFSIPSRSSYARIDRFEEFDPSGNLIHRTDNSYPCDQYFFYDSLNNLTAEKLVRSNNKSELRIYKNVYSNGDLIQWIYPEKCDTFFYTYENHKLMKRVLFKTKTVSFTRIFGGEDPFIFSEDSPELLVYEYKNESLTLKVKAERKSQDSLKTRSLINYRKGKLQQKAFYFGRDYYENYYYKKGELVGLAVTNSDNKIRRKYYLKREKKLIKEMSFFIEREDLQKGLGVFIYDYTFWE